MLKIMIVDDSDTAYLSLKRILRTNHPCEIYRAENGLEGLKILEKENIDGVFLDLNMPVMDGIEMLECIRQDKKYKNIPVMMLSSTTNKVEIEKAIRLEIFDYLLKPIDFGQSIKRLQNYFDFLNSSKNFRKTIISSETKKSVIIISHPEKDWNDFIDSHKMYYNIRITKSSVEGLQLFLKEIPEIIILDHALPLMDEKFLAKKISDIMEEKLDHGLKWRTTIISINPNKTFDESSDFTHIVKDNEELEAVLVKLEREN